MEIIFGVVLGVIAFTMALSLVRINQDPCDHDWEMVNHAETRIWKDAERKTGYIHTIHVRVHECKKCKKISRKRWKTR